MMHNGTITEWCPRAGSGEGLREDGEGSGLISLALCLCLLVGQ